MKILSRLSISCAVLALLSTSAYADGNLRGYVGTKLGDAYTINSVSGDDTYSKSAFTVNPFVGVQYRDGSVLGSRVELEGFFHSKASKEIRNRDGSVQSLGFFVNYNLDFCVSKTFVPYIAFGAGYAHSKVTYAGFEGKKDSLAWNAGAGLGINLTDNLGLDIGARFADYGTYKGDVDLKAVDFLAGIKYTF